MQERIELIRRMLSVSSCAESLHAIKRWRALQPRPAEPFPCITSLTETQGHEDTEKTINNDYSRNATTTQRNSKA
jgi:hypothetical protein